MIQPSLKIIMAQKRAKSASRKADLPRADSRTFTGQTWRYPWLANRAGRANSPRAFAAKKKSTRDRREIQAILQARKPAEKVLAGNTARRKGDFAGKTTTPRDAIWQHWLSGEPTSPKKAAGLLLGQTPPPKNPQAIPPLRGDP